MSSGQTPGASTEPSAAARILLVDDDEGNREVLGYVLKRNGFVVTTAATGEEGLDILARGRVDLIVLDLVMPGLGGLETLRIIRTSHSPAALPVVIVTGLDAADDVATAKNLGANDYVSKPYQLADALARIRALVHATTA
jgi:DNA-binding response OmpR family regulator